MKKKVKAILHSCEWMGDRITKISNDWVEIDNSSTEAFVNHMQKLVGGYFEIVRHNGKLLYVDDEGLLKNKPLNFWASQKGLHLVGNVVEVDQEYES